MKFLLVWLAILGFVASFWILAIGGLVVILGR